MQLFILKGIDKGMDEKELQTAQYEDIDPNLFWSAVTDIPQDLKKALDGEVIVPTEVEPEVANAVLQDVASKSEEVMAETVVPHEAVMSQEEPEAAQKNSSVDSFQRAETLPNDVPNDGAAEVAKGKVKEKKISIEEQYQSDENGARVRFHKWKWNNTVSNIILVFSMSIFLICAIELGLYFYSSYRYTASMSELQNGMGGGIVNSDLLEEILKNQENRDPVRFPDEADYDIVVRPNHPTELSNTWKNQYAYLTSVNPDCAGYITIPNTVLDYPVMFTPADYLYYLYRNFSGEYEYRGTPFLDYQTKLGQSQNIIVYGHNMTDGMMFGTLREYLDESYYKDHKYVYFNTSVSEGVYEVMAVVKTKIYNVEDECFKYYRYGGVLTKDQFETYVTEMKAMSQYDTGVNAVWGDELISLSTCNRYTEEGRLVIVCKRIN